MTAGDKKPLRQIGRARRRAAAPASASRPTAPSIPRRQDDGPAPLSFAQERLWFLEQINPGTPLFNVPVAARLRGPLDAARLERGFAAVVARHDTLRTHFVEQDGVPRQIVDPPGPVQIDRVDLRGAEQPWTEAVEFAHRDAHRPFDPTTPPLWRVTLLELGPDDHLLVLVVHHCIAEGAGIATCFGELAKLYGAPSTSLPELPIQYADFAAWQRGRAADPESQARQLEYWAQQLKGPLPTLQLPTDRPRPALPAARGAWQWVQLPNRLTSQIDQLAQSERSTVFMVLLASYAALLHRYTNQTDIVIGAPISQRDRPELHPLIGFFVNTLVLRIDVSGDPSFRELVHRVRSVALDAYAHSEVPFETVVEHLHPDRHATHNPMFQVMLEVPTDPMPVLALPGLEPARIMGPLELNTGTSKADLATFMWREGDHTIAAIEYDTDLFDATTVERMLANFEALIEGCLTDPDRQLSSVVGLAPLERRRILHDWNDTAVEYRLDACVHQLVEEQVREQPEALAVAGPGGVELTYGQWNRRANQIAHYLRSRGVGRDVLVGVLMDRTPEMVTALLGVLKAGGAYVPLDPVNPAERQALMLEDAGVPVLLAQESTLGGLPEIDGEVLCIDRDHAALDAQPDTDPEVITTVDHLAYVIFTSGSTGRPKGVQIPHRALLNLVFWHRREYAVTPADHATQIAGLAFDASVWELWPYFTAGASMHLPDEATRGEPARLLQWLADRAITLSFVPTPLAEAMLAEPAPADMPLRAMLTGGDKLHRPPPAGLPFALVNHYGPTENAVVATFTRVDPAGSAADAAASPPIGRPIDNVRIYVLDEHRRPVPIGVAGELHVAGASLARGYHGRPDLTDDRFVPDPFAPGERMYRTGDLVRYAPDGNVEFLGRIDHQVKVRGFRIELGEIEVLLRQHPAVRDGVVLARRDGDDAQTRLVGYVIPGGAEPSVDELRGFLQDRLPDYMVPQAYVCMSAFPLTANDKIDRQALPAPERQHSAAGSGEVAAPENDAQEKIAALWRELLGVDQVGIHDNFFDLGGHSMLLVQLHRRLNEAFDQELAVAEVFRYPTVAAMAQHLAGTAPETDAAATETRAAQRKAGTERQRRRRERRRRG